jgi:homoserine O-succinyltransferase
MSIASSREPAQLLGPQALPACPPPAGARPAPSPVRVVLLNGAAQKCDGDLRIARLLGNTALQVELTILRDQHAAERDISPHLLHFYRTFTEVQARAYDALVVVGHGHGEGSPFARGGEGGLEEVIAWSCRQGHAVLLLGAAAAAVLGLRYGVGARRLPARRSGVVRHRLVAIGEPLLRGHDRSVWVPVVDPHGLVRADLPSDGALTTLAESAQAGIHILRDAARRHTFVLNDISAEGAAIAPRRAGGSDERAPGPGGGARRRERGWRAHAQLLFANWLALDAGRQPPAPPPAREVAQQDHGALA